MRLVYNLCLSRLSPLLAALLALAGCKASPPVPAGPVPSFRRDLLPTLQLNCASARGCHGLDASDEVDLDLRPAQAWRQLVNQAAVERANTYRVKPGAPEQSFLVDKLAGRLGAREGKRMPLDPTTDEPRVPNPLPPDFVERSLTPWISAGAPDN